MPTASMADKRADWKPETDRSATAEEMGSFLRYIHAQYPGSLRDAFHQIDLFNSGRLSHVEFKQCAKFYKGDINAIFYTLHVGKAGNLSEAEFMMLEAVQFVRFLRAQSHDSLAELFAQLDFLNNGILKKDEFIQGLRDYEGDAEAVFHMIDRKNRNYIGLADVQVCLNKAMEFAPEATPKKVEQVSFDYQGGGAALDEIPVIQAKSLLWIPGQGDSEECPPPGVRELAEEHELDELISASGAGDWVIVEFAASWSAACVAMREAVDTVARERFESSVVRVDVDLLPETAARHGATRVPFYSIYVGGQKDMEFAGASERKFREVVANCAAPVLWVNNYCLQ